MRIEQLPEIVPDAEESKKVHYFCNEVVEDKLTRYSFTGCTDVDIRNSIMDHATDLIVQLIRKQGLYKIYRGHDPSSFNELVHVAYCQIERTLYKYRSRPHCRACFSYERPNNSVLYEPARYEFGIITPQKLIEIVPNCPHCGIKLRIDTRVEPEQGLYGGTYDILYKGMSKVFNMWSQVTRTVILAHVKKDTRDTRNSDSYTDHINKKYVSGNNEKYIGAMVQIKDKLWFSDDCCRIVDVLMDLSTISDPEKNFKKRLCAATGLDRKAVEDCLSVIRVMMSMYAENFNEVSMKLG